MGKMYGNTWWGNEWLNTLSEIDFSNRLPRGRTYANMGAVSDIKIKGNKITANVKGRQFLPYKVRFVIPKFTAEEKDKITALISSNPLYLSKLLNRTVPSAIKEECQKKGIPLFPSSWNDLDGSCSCPDFAVPCKHMAAVLYLIANEIDKNPFLIFQIHDFDLFQNLEQAGYTAPHQQELEITTTKSLMRPFDRNKTINSWDEETFQSLDFSRIPDIRSHLLTILSKNPVFYPNGDFRNILGQMYARVSKHTNDIPESNIDDFDFGLDKVHDLEILLDEDFDFVNATFRDIKGKTIKTFDALDDLLKLIQAIPLKTIQFLNTSIRSLVLAYQFAYKLAVQSALVPQLLHVRENHFRVRWIPALLHKNVASLFDGVKSIIRTDLLYYKKGKTIYEPLEEDALQSLLSLYLNHLVKTGHRLDQRFAEHEIGHLFFNSTILSFQDYETKEYPVAIQIWLNSFFLIKKAYTPVIYIDEEINQEQPGFWVNIAAEINTAHGKKLIPFFEILENKTHRSVRIDLLRDFAILSAYFPVIEELVERRGKEDLFFSSKEFVDVLFEIIPTIKLFGIKILLPKALRRVLRPKLSIKIKAEKKKEKQSSNATLNIHQLLSFDWQIAMGNQAVSQMDFMEMLESYEGIVKLNDQYVFFDENEMKTLLQKLQNPPKFNHRKLLQVAIAEEYNGAAISLDTKAQKLLNNLLKSEPILPPKGLKATLRPYQLRGYEWLYKNARLGFGSLLADDMGLGKTLQVISVLLKFKEEGRLEQQKALIIVPTTLLTNWIKEMAKFAPDLIAQVYHGPSRKLKNLDQTDVLVTTYGVARTDVEKLKKPNWLLVAIDEAQAIKNPDTAQTKAIKKIDAPIRIAMSGTPVENRLSEYWSVFDFANKGYLEGLVHFKKAFVKPIEIERDQEALDRFKKITAPFILRRLKSDKSIISDLPDKVEQDQYCQLRPEQAAIYQNVVDITLNAINEATGINRKGLVLKLLTSLKQVCNHPAQYLKQGDTDPGLSGKAMMLIDLMHRILENGEKILIFTQYQEMGKIIVTMLENNFKLNVPFLHGGLSRKQRDQMVEDFQNNPQTRVLILSLKAGGTGLNLTAASNVIHYDLWWNPAVEAQATDRAYRIGQKRKVQVHRLITESTFEEKINALLKSKKELAELTVATGEKWIGDLSNEALKEMVALE